MINEATLMATKQLLRLVLLRERESADHGAPITVAPPAELEACLNAVSSEELLAAIQRHRLEIVLHGDSLVSALLPDLADKLKTLARAEAMAALALASLTREMAAVFEEAGIPMLVIKGVPLSLQTTGSLTARGRGDLDLLVEPERVADAVQLLEQHGFARKPGMFPNNLNSVWGRYSRWAGYELSLIRKQKTSTHWIDLHWALSNVRAPLPDFQEALDCCDLLNINGQEVATLCRQHAFRHACAHAAKDQWMCLRNLLDIARLAHGLDQQSLRSMRRFRTIRFSCAITQELAEANTFSNLFNCAEASSARVLQEAHAAQLLPWRSQGDGPWRLRSSISVVARMLRLSFKGEDWLRTFLYYTLLPSAFSDPATGKDLGLIGMAKVRVRRFKQRAGERSQKSGPAANA